MKRLLFLPLLAGMLGSWGLTTDAETDNTGLECLNAALLTPGESGNGRQYAPDREVRMVHLALEITPDFKHRTIEGKAELHFRPTAKPVTEIKFDAVELDIHSVHSTVGLAGWQTTPENVVVTFSKPVPADQEVAVTITYSAEPQNGLYFRTPEMGYKEGDTHLFTQGEAITARQWYPCLDSPNQRLTSEITCRVPEGMTVISNGRLVAKTKNPATGLVAFHWSQDKPHSSYLLSLVAGYFKELQDRCGDIPLSFFTPPSEAQEAINSFRDTKDIMTFFQEEIGVPYPWDKYSQTCVNDFVAGGMENTSATTLTDGTLFTEATENLRSSEGLIAHEMAHQWFGDLVTCKDWSHLWLNEGFATYYETLYLGHKHGRDAMLYELHGRLRSLTSIPNDTNAIVRRTFAEPDEMFGYLSYPKASWVLQMLRCQLGEPLYRACIKTYLERHRYGNVTTEDLRQVIEELSGRSYDRFFDQWLYHAHCPELEVSYNWDETAKLAKLSIRQVQALSPAVLLFDFPLTIRFHGPSGAVDKAIEVSKKEEDFYFALPAKPEWVRLDPDCTLLAKIQFPLSKPMLEAQLKDRDDVVGRLLAVEQLSDKVNQEAIAGLRDRLNNDPFYGVRVEAAKGLAAIHADEALTALLASTHQPDARVRHQVVEGIGGFYNDQARDYLQQEIQAEKNPGIAAAAIRQRGGYADPQVNEVLVRLLQSTSYRNELADAAIASLRLADDPSAITPLVEALGDRASEFTSHGFAQGLEAVGYLARNEANKDKVREFLEARVNDKRRLVKMASLRALGMLGDPKAIAVAMRFASAGKYNPLRTTAERVLADLRGARKPVDDFKNLRQEVLDLEKANRDLRKEIESLKKQVEAGAKGDASSGSEAVHSKVKVRSPKSE